MRGNGKEIIRMDMAFSNMHMETNTKETGLMIKNKVKVDLHSLKELSTKGNLKKMV